MSATLRNHVAALAWVWLLSSVVMAQTAGGGPPGAGHARPLGGLGGRELILIAAIAVLLVGVSRLAGLPRARPTAQSHHGVGGAQSRAYLDRLLGPARHHALADEPPETGLGRAPASGSAISKRCDGAGAASAALRRTPWLAGVRGRSRRVDPFFLDVEREAHGAAHPGDAPESHRATIHKETER